MNVKEKIELSNLRPEPAADFLTKIAKEHSKELSLICLAPLTNIAAAIEKDKDFPGHIKEVFILGGSYLGIGNVSICAEYNFFSNPEAAELTINTFQHVTIVPWDIIKYQQSMPQSISEEAF